MATVDSHLSKGLQHARDSKYDEAIKEFDVLLASNQAEAKGFYYRACAKLHLEKYQSAIEDFNLAISSQELSLDHELQALYKRGYAYYKRDQFDSALDDYRRFLTRCKEKNRKDLKHKGLFGIGCIHAALNQHEQAIEYFGDAIKSSKDGNTEEKQKLYYLHRGRAYACCARFNEAEDDLIVVIQQSNDSFIKGCAYNELGKHQKALQQFDSSLGNKSQTTIHRFEENLRFRRGLSHASLDSHDKALDDYQYILDHSIGSNSPSMISRVFFRKGLSNMALQDTHDALISFNESTSRNDKQSDVFYARAMVHFTLGRYDAAVCDHIRAMQLGGLRFTTPSIYNTLYDTHNYNKTILRNIYYNQLTAAKQALEEDKRKGLNDVENHRRVAEYLQRLAPYTYDPESIQEEARPYIEAALKSSNPPRSQDTVISAIHQLRQAQILCEKYPGGIGSKRIVEQFIDLTTNAIMEMGLLFERCQSKKDWNDLLDSFRDLMARSCSEIRNPFNLFRYETIQIQLGKAQMMKKTVEKFEGSPEQQEFYKKLFIRLCNMFDATRAATTGIFQHALTGTLGQVSWGFMILGKVFEQVPGFGSNAALVLGFVEQGLQKLDQLRIQNALTEIGCLETAQKLNETADELAEKLTMMYKWQIVQFPTSDKESQIDKQEKSKKSSCCATCCNACIRCLTRTKNSITNDREDTTMKSLAKYATSLILARLIELETSKIDTIINLRDSFLNAVCNVPHEPKILRKIMVAKIKPSETKTDNNDWDTHQFFRGPAIQFSNDDRRTDKHMDYKKFGYRQPSWNEEESYKTDPKKFDTPAFTKIQIEEGEEIKS